MKTKSGFFKAFVRVMVFTLVGLVGCDKEDSQADYECIDAVIERRQQAFYDAVDAVNNASAEEAEAKCAEAKARALVFLNELQACSYYEESWSARTWVVILEDWKNKEDCMPE